MLSTPNMTEKNVLKQRLHSWSVVKNCRVTSQLLRHDYSQQFQQYTSKSIQILTVVKCDEGVLWSFLLLVRSLTLQWNSLIKKLTTGQHLSQCAH